MSRGSFFSLDKCSCGGALFLEVVVYCILGVWCVKIVQWDRSGWSIGARKSREIFRVQNVFSKCSCHLLIILTRFVDMFVTSCI